MKKRLLHLLLISILVILVIPPMTSFGREEGNVSDKEAQFAALFQVKLDQTTVESSLWKDKNISVEKPILVYDMTGNLSSYIVNLKENNVPAGYVEVGSSKDDYPILSFGYVNNRLNDTQKNNLINKKNKSKIQVSEKAVAMGVGRFGMKIDYEDGTADVLGNAETIILDKEKNKLKEKKEKIYNNDSRKRWKHIDELITSEIGTTSDGVTDSLSFETGWQSVSNNNPYSGVGDVFQYPNALWTGPSGCAPTSAFNLLAFYKPNYTSLYSNQDTAIKDLRVAMGTDNSGGTVIISVGPGLQSYARNKGYSNATATTHTSPTWQTVQLDAVQSPSLITFTNQTYYSPGSGHTVTGVGWVEYYYSGSSAGHQYMKIHDNWDTTPELVYVAYGRNYDNLWSVAFHM